MSHNNPALAETGSTNLAKRKQTTELQVQGKNLSQKNKVKRHPTPSLASACTGRDVKALTHIHHSRRARDAPSLVGCLPSIHRTLHELDVAVYPCNPSKKAERFEIQVILNYIGSSELNLGLRNPIFQTNKEKESRRGRRNNRKKRNQNTETKIFYENQD